ncbi:nucleotidyltransferase domain-containing protein [Patescibacteria group bacterium]|nr:nucleotidyltransferase domain-containing protein [Patescibacteria group bacterium]
MINTTNLVKKLKPFDPEKIIIFGSYAKDKANPESDIDLLIIKRTKKKPTDRIAELLPLIWGHVPHIEPQIFTPEEFSQAISQNRFFITKEVLKYGKTIYEKTQ